jgi:hypothetical protein
MPATNHRARKVTQVEPLTDDHRPTRGQFRFTVPLADLKMDASGDPEAQGRWTMRGHAAVFNRLSHDMGGFRVKIAPGFFTKVLDSNPDVHLNREHDMRLLLARTRNNSLELREDPYGLHAWARFVKTPPPTRRRPSWTAATSTR